MRDRKGGAGRVWEFGPPTLLHADPGRQRRRRFGFERGTSRPSALPAGTPSSPLINSPAQGAEATQGARPKVLGESRKARVARVDSERVLGGRVSASAASAASALPRAPIPDCHTARSVCLPCPRPAAWSCARPRLPAGPQLGPHARARARGARGERGSQAGPVARTFCSGLGPWRPRHRALQRSTRGADNGTLLFRRRKGHMIVFYDACNAWCPHLHLWRPGPFPT